MKLIYNTPVEVNQTDYNRIIIEAAGVIAHRRYENGRFWIKLMMPKFRHLVKL